MTYWLLNVRLESGFVFEKGIVTGTKSELCDVLIKHGRISVIEPASGAGREGAAVIDAGGLLALPSFAEMHCHLDKTMLADNWQACRLAKNRIEIFDYEKNTLPKLPTSMADRAKHLISSLLGFGSTHIRTHVDIYPESGLDHLAAVKEALSAYEGSLSAEIVAFPQHGLLRSKSAGLVREALRNGAGIVGGVDPAEIDGNIEASLQQMMDLAVEANADIDLHLHDPGHLGAFTIRRLAALTEEAGWQGRVTISHAYCLGDLSQAEAGALAEMMAGLQISLITSVPIRFPIPPIPLLREKGVSISLGCDNIFDLWSPFGNGDILERAARLAERFAWRDEVSLSRALGFISGGITPLDGQGQRIWPLVGDDASFVLIDASCSAEAVARLSRRQATLVKGKLVAGFL